MGGILTLFCLLPPKSPQFHLTGGAASSLPPRDDSQKLHQRARRRKTSAVPRNHIRQQGVQIRLPAFPPF